MSLEYAYNYAIIYRPLKVCNEVRTCTNNCDNSSDKTYLFIPTQTDDSIYLMKYYDETTNKWYYDKEMSNEWIPPEGTGTPIIPPTE